MRLNAMIHTRFFRRIVLGLLLPVLAGCAIKLGAKFDSSRITQIQPGVTTQAEIQEMLGSPSSEGIKNGRPLWTYLYARIPMMGTTRGTILSIEFDDGRRVETYSYIPY